jgi:hypothetical protein
MITTLQVRAIIAKYQTIDSGIWTNKTNANPGDLRTVKTYHCGNDRMLKALRRAAGNGNVKLTAGVDRHYGYAGGFGAGIVVKCVLA